MTGVISNRALTEPKRRHDKSFDRSTNNDISIVNMHDSTSFCQVCSIGENRFYKPTFLTNKTDKESRIATQTEKLVSSAPSH